MKKRLLLTSTGLANSIIRDFFISQIDALPGKMVGLVSACRTYEESLYVKESIAELKRMGVSVEELNIVARKSFSEILEFDIYYVCGGNTFFILDQMRRSGMDKILSEAIDMGKLYIGVSAGSIIASKDIEIAGVGPLGDPNDINLSNLEGLEKIPFYVHPHYSVSERKYIENFYKKKKTPLVAITDSQAVYVEGDDIFLVGIKGGLRLGGLKIDDRTFSTESSISPSFTH